jgi:hypothetical protein
MVLNLLQVSCKRAYHQPSSSLYHQVIPTYRGISRMAIMLSPNPGTQPVTVFATVTGMCRLLRSYTPDKVRIDNKISDKRRGLSPFTIAGYWVNQSEK